MRRERVELDPDSRQQRQHHVCRRLGRSGAMRGRDALAHACGLDRRFPRLGERGHSCGRRLDELHELRFRVRDKPQELPLRGGWDVKRLVFLLVLTLAVSTTTAFAATLNVSSWHLWAG